MDAESSDYCSDHIDDQYDCESETSSFGCYWIDEDDGSTDCMPVDGTCSDYDTDSCEEHE
jgi:hypothetical protein